MPYAPAFRDDPNLQKPKRVDLCISAFAHPYLVGMANVFPAEHPRGGYPELMLFATISGIRAWSSMQDGLRHLTEEKVWHRATKEYAAATGAQGPFPRTAPTMRVLEGFYARYAKLSPNERVRISLSFMDTSVAFAVALGQFTRGVAPDFTKADHRHIVMGDGSYVAPWSGAQYIQDPVTEELVVVGSRATVGKPRIQATRTDPTFDEKHAIGINHVTLSTWTEAGWIILGVDQALGAEKDAAIRLLQACSQRLGDGLHVIIWDRVLTGHLIGWALSNLRALVINKSVARERIDREKPKKGKKKKDPAITAAAEHEARAMTSTRRPRRSPYVKLTTTEAIEKYLAGEPLPLGTSVYPTTKGHEMVRGVVHHYGPPCADIPCAHDLWVDDGALVDVVRDPVTGFQMKVSTAEAITSVPVRLENGYQLVTTWNLPCHNEDEDTTHTFTTVWTPEPEPNSETQKALAAMRPISRVDERFSNKHGLRNITESINMWIKSRLSRTRRAGHLHVEDQRLDHLAVAHLSNAGTARRARLLDLLG